MERAEGLLGGKSLFKSQNDGTIDKTKVVCSICQAAEEAARLEIITLMQSTRQKAVPG